MFQRESDMTELFSRKVFLKLVSLVVLTTFTSGCAFFGSIDFGNPGYKEVKMERKLPKVTYSTSFSSEKKDYYPAIATNLPKITKRVFRKAEVFHSFKEAGEKKNGYHLDIRVSGGMGGESDSGISALGQLAMMGLCYATFTIFPAFMDFNFDMEVDVKKNGKVVKTYHYENHYRMWVNILMLPVGIFKGQLSAQRKLTEEMLLKLIYDLQKDKKILR